MKKLAPLIPLVLFSSHALASPATLAIHTIKDRSANHVSGSCALVGIWASPGEAVRELLTDEILKIGGVEIVERDEINEIYEAEFENKNLEKTAEKKKFLAADVVLTGVISEFESCTKNEESQIGLGSLIGIDELGVGYKSSTAHVAMDLRLVSVKTGKIIKTFRNSGQIEDEGLSLSVGVLGNRLSRDAFEKAPLGKATKQAVAEAATQIVAEIKKLK